MKGRFQPANGLRQLPQNNGSCSGEMGLRIRYEAPPLSLERSLIRPSLLCISSPAATAEDRQTDGQTYRLRGAARRKLAD